MQMDPEKGKSYFEQANRLVEWIADELIHKKNWVALLVLLSGVIYVAFNPYEIPFRNLFNLFLESKNFTWYQWAFWSVVGILFIAAVVVAARRKKREAAKAQTKEKSEDRESEPQLVAIKCLYPFEHNYKDIEIFASLQRGVNVSECLQAMKTADWRFGVLSGESGAGKTSFLQAGLWHAIEEQNVRCVYVKFSNSDPFQSVKEACVKQLSLSEVIAEDDDFLSVLDKAAKQKATPLVLIFDQFEQFFVNRKQKNERKPFVQAMSDWHTKENGLPIKILISIRGDFVDRLSELQKAMRYSLGPSQNFRLERFEPQQATEIFCALAEREKIAYNRSFISSMTSEQLADKDDGLISPVDIQVLAWMVAGQADKENRAFNRLSFQRIGGVEGLLERYLKRTLKTCEPKARREAVIKVLLALIDLERNTRAGALPIGALHDKLKKLNVQISGADLQEAVNWLLRSDVRLIAPASEDLEEKFELAHERIIPAIRRQANKILEPAARAYHLLENRANEWIGSGRNPRYLFSFAELRLIKKHPFLITKGKDDQHKEALLTASRTRLKLRAALMSIPVLLFTLGWFGWDTNIWQIYLIKRELRSYGSRLNDDVALRDIAAASAIAGDSQAASEVLDRITDADDKAAALCVVAEAFAKLDNKTEAHNLLNRAVEVANTIFYADAKAAALRVVAEAFAKLDNKTEAHNLLNRAVEVANTISDADAKAAALHVVAEAFAKLAISTQDTALLNRAVEVTNTISDADAKAAALRVVAKAFAKLAISTQDTALLNRAVEVANTISDADAKAAALHVVAEAFAKLDNKTEAHNLLNRAVEVANTISDAYAKAAALRAAAEAFAKLAISTQDTALLNRAVEVTNTISYAYVKAAALRAAAEAFAKLAISTQDTALLNCAVEVANTISDADAKAAALRAVAQAFAKLAISTQDTALLNCAVEVANTISDADAKAAALRVVAEAFAKLDNKTEAHNLLNRAVEVANAISYADAKAAALRAVAQASVKLSESMQNDAVFKESFILVEKVSDDGAKYAILQAITNSRLALDDVKILRTLASHFNSEAGRARALARILTVYSYPALIEESRKEQEEEEEE